MPTTTLSSPLGSITLEALGGTLISLTWGEPAPPSADSGEASDESLLAEAARQLDDWFAHRRTDFDLPLAPRGSAFQQQVWQTLNTIPYGTTVTYGVLARQLGNVARAIGTACGRNPLPIVIPCHRVVGSSGLGGFSAPGGLAAKRWLLAHEKVP